MGVIPNEKLTECDKVTVSAFCRYGDALPRHCELPRLTVPPPRVWHTVRPASSRCPRRRLAVVMVRLKMAETVKEAVTFIEQGRTRLHRGPPGLPQHTAVSLMIARPPPHAPRMHANADVRVGPEPVNDPAFLVTR